jgi:hypothetical protein
MNNVADRASVDAKSERKSATAKLRVAWFERTLYLSSLCL